MRTRLAKLARLNADEWQILLAAACLLPATALFLRVFGYRHTRAWMARYVEKKSERADARLEAARVARLVSVAARHGVYRANCLRQALVAWWLLGRRGVATNLVIGVRKDEQGFAAHAWVELDGDIVLGGADSRERFQSMH
jgi:hypothetical protein